MIKHIFPFLTILIIFPFITRGQNFIPFSPDGKMEGSIFNLEERFMIGLKPSFHGVIFMKLDSVFVNDTSLLFAELKTRSVRKTNDVEYFYYYNGTADSLNLTSGFGIEIVKCAQTKRGDTWPITALTVPTCGTCYRGISKVYVKSGEVIIFSFNTTSTKGNFKTMAKLRIKTNLGIISTPQFVNYIDQNSFYINDSYRPMFRRYNDIKAFRKFAFLEP